MLTNVEGKVRNTDVPISKPLLPLFEAITNSFHSIEDAKRDPGRIDITILREGQRQLSENDRTYAEIVGFRVTDNGIGFIDTNYRAFNESETTFKADRGGKGVGRFTWLVAFDNVRISSAFEQDGKPMIRTFLFVPVGDGIEEALVKPRSNGYMTTTVELTGFKSAYQRQCPKKPETIASYIIEHFLEFLSAHTVRISSFTMRHTMIPLTCDEFLNKKWSPNRLLNWCVLSQLNSVFSTLG